MFMITVDEELCTGCGECAQICPVQIFAMKDGKSAANDDDGKCLGCQSCVSVCPVGAITVEEF